MSIRQTRYGSAGVRYSADVGFQSYMLSIYGFMTLGLGLTGLVAFIMNNLPVAFRPAAFILSLVSIFATFGISLYMSFAFQRLTAQRANVLFWAYSLFMGMGLHMVFARYTAASLSNVFLITAGTFGITTAYGYMTKRDLSSMGSLLFMGLIGICVAGFANMFFHSSALQFAVSCISCLVFTGLIAYDTQRLKEIYYCVSDEETRQKNAILGALNLYMSVINLFLSLLNLFGERKK